MADYIALENDEKTAYAEEKQNLSVIENAISNEIANEEATYNKYMEEVNDAYIVDWEDRERVQSYRKLAQRTRGRIQEYQSYIPSPYYARMDMSCDGGEVKTYLIGKQGLTIGVQPYVLDWRSEVGGTFANKHDTSFLIKEHEYKLFLRRAVDIQDATVKAVFTEYDIDSTSLDGEIIDPFLLSVLRDKRRNYKLSDIIRTIQANQNELIRKPLEESFIVQGCAGSGKTMILLHRLSYIAFHYSNINFERFYILTPNENFNLHIDELSRELELTKIKRFTVDRFYISWIRFLGRNDIIISGNERLAKHRLKVDLIDENIRSEKGLCNSLLEEIYSEPFFIKILNELNEQWNLIIKQVKHTLEKANIAELDLQNSKSKFACFRNVTNTITSTINASKRAEIDLKKAEQSINSAKIELRDEIINYKKLSETISTQLNEVKKDIENKYHEFLQKIERHTSLEKGLQEKEYEKRIVEKELVEQTECLFFITSHMTQLCSLDYLKNNPDDFSKSILLHCSDQIQSVEKATENMKSVPFYNFGKRNKAKAELNIEQSKLEEQISDFIQTNVTELNKCVTLAKDKLSTIEKALVDLRHGINSLDDSSASEIYSLLDQCQHLIQTNDFPDFGSFLKPSDIHCLPQSIGLYIENYKKYKEKERLVAELKKRIELRQSELKNAQSTIRASEEETALESVLKTAEKLDFRAFDEYLDNQLESTYKKFNQSYSRGYTYHHILVYKLLHVLWTISI